MEDLTLHMLDITRNSIDAGATFLQIEVVEDFSADRLVIEMRDNGPGMDMVTLAQAVDPFFTTRKTRRVGLGLALLHQATRAAGGSVTIESAPGDGVQVRATFRHSHIDRAPLGDIETMLVVLVAGNPGLDVRFRHTLGERMYEVDSRDLRSSLGAASMGSPEGIRALREAVRAGEAALAEDKRT